MLPEGSYSGESRLYRTAREREKASLQMVEHGFDDQGGFPTARVYAAVVGSSHSNWWIQPQINFGPDDLILEFADLPPPERLWFVFTPD
jgi:hypothetical protein